MTKDRWRCSGCGEVFLEKQFLLAANPFDKNDMISGCPHCKQVTEGFEKLCDEPGCNKVYTCGWPCKETGTYRVTCSDHYKHET